MDEEHSMDELAAGLLSNPPSPPAPPEPGPAASQAADISRETPSAAAPPESSDTNAIEPSAEPGSEPEQPDEQPEPVYPLQVDGREVHVTLRDALESHRRQLAAPQQQEEIAAHQRDLAVAAEQMRAERAQYGALLAGLQQQIGASSGEPTAEQWNALREADPARYATEWADNQRREKYREAVAAEQQRVAQQQAHEQRARLHQALESERARMFAALPVLADPTKGDAEMAELRAYARKLGYSDAEIAQAYDHRMVVAVHKARLWDQQEAARTAAERKLAAAPQMPAPAGRQGLKGPKQNAREAAQKRFEQTGRVEDGWSLLIQ
jgi:hypothetical protein